MHCYQYHFISGCFCRTFIVNYWGDKNWCANHCQCYNHAQEFFSLLEAAFHQIQLFREALEPWTPWFQMKLIVKLILDISNFQVCVQPGQEVLYKSQEQLMHIIRLPTP